MTLPVPVYSAEDVVAKLRAHPSVLLSTKRCSQGWVKNPDEYYVCEVIGVSHADWKKSPAP
jgi:hypothetical protein